MEYATGNSEELTASIIVAMSFVVGDISSFEMSVSIHQLQNVKFQKTAIFVLATVRILKSYQIIEC
jgi:hypothetical protein